MSVDVQVPRLAESISDAVLVEWLKADGATVRADEPIVTLETDKAAVEIAASEPGVLRHARKPGERVVVGDVLARIEPGAAPERAPVEAAARGAEPALATPNVPAEASKPVPAAEAPKPAAPAPKPPASPASAGNGGEAAPQSPAVRRLLEESGVDPASVTGTGKGGRLLKEDVLRHLEASGAGAATPPDEAPAAAPAKPAPADAPAAARSGEERVVPMSRLRQRIAERLVRAQQTAAILTTFNEIDMSAVMALRARHRDAFEKRHGVKLGFMSFFTRAAVEALRETPEINATIRGTDIVYPSGVHMGVAVGTDRGLVVPVVRDADRKSFAEIEREIERLAGRARANALTLDELAGGTFTISNGGVYGSLLSTPILNPPQSGILGLHKIEKRPVAVGDEVAIRPMMYVALSYDHRIVDGEQAVGFLVRVKERVEDPERLLLEV